MQRDRANRRLPLAALAAALVTVLAAGCGGGNDATFYSKASLAHSKCGNLGNSVGDRVEPALMVKNLSGENWEATYLQLVGNSTFQLNEISLNGKGARYRGPGIFRLGDLRAGATGRIRIRFTADEQGGSTVYYTVWGGTETDARVPSEDIPDDAPALTCNYKVR
jgi:hypothetical protein